MVFKRLQLLFKSFEESLLNTDICVLVLSLVLLNLFFYACDLEISLFNLLINRLNLLFTNFNVSLEPLNLSNKGDLLLLAFSKNFVKFVFPLYFLLEMLDLLEFVLKNPVFFCFVVLSQILENLQMYLLIFQPIALKLHKLPLEVSLDISNGLVFAFEIQVLAVAA